MPLALLLTLILLNYLRKSLNTAGHQEWNNKIYGFLIAGVALMAFTIAFGKTRNILQFVNFAIVAVTFYYVFTNKIFAAGRPMAMAFLPMVILSFVEFITKVISYSFYKSWYNYIQSAQLFAFIWMIALFIINNRQKKAIERERLKTEEKEKEIKISEAMKAELEIQVRERTIELTRQKEELQQTLQELKATQSQLVQSEKMASLGELTAGIAHEIQNPLNFVNNFSEVNKELLEELRTELAEGNIQVANEIIGDISDNSEKINHHGKRADAIVKGMLQHSRASSANKELANINQLADEYLRLAYHGLRAKDKSFNATLKTEFAEDIGTINIFPQDIGRVILNLITNAFYAVNEKKIQRQSETAGIKYEPTVTVKTAKRDNQIFISVSDNGNGIPDKVKEKIFQPFFTTKPTGQGTGLGLSMSHEIVTKGHSGKLEVATKENEGTTFTIILPV